MSNLELQTETQPNVIAMPTCEHCDGNAVVLKINQRIQHGQDGWSKIVPCLHCKDGREHARWLFEKRFGDTGMPQSYKDYRLKHFKELPSHQLAGKERAIGAACVFCDQFPAVFSSQEIFDYIGEDYPHTPQHCHSLSFCGDYGVGKTALASAVANTLVVAGIDVVFVKLMELIKKVQAAYGGNGNPDEIIESAQQAHLLILDECNLNNYSDDRKEILERIIYYRNNHQKPYILTMNIDQQQFEKAWGMRIASRVNQDCHWFVFGGDVLRPKSTLF